MTNAAEHILREALELNESDRATLAGLLIESLEDAPDDGLEEAWAAEVERRAADLDSGAVVAIPWEEVRARLFRSRRGEIDS